MSPHSWSLFGSGSCVHCAEDCWAPGRGISPPFPWKIPYSCEERCHRWRPRLVANRPDKGPESRFCDLLKRLWENWPLGEMIEDLWSNPSKFSFKFELKKAKQQKGLKCTTEMPGGPLLLNPRLLLAGCIIAGKSFFVWFFRSCLCLPKRFQSCPLRSGARCAGCVSGWRRWWWWPLPVPLSLIFLWLQHTPHEAWMETAPETNGCWEQLLAY